MSETPTGTSTLIAEPRAASSYDDLIEKYDLCPLCSSEDFSMVLERACTSHPMWHPKLPPTLKWCNCHKCDHVFTEGYWTDKALELVFSKTQPYQQPLAQLDMQRGVSGRMIERLLPF